MKSTVKTIEHRQVELRIEAEPPEYAAAEREALKHFASKVEIPGFRKGKAPQPLIERQVGREAVVDKIVERLFVDLYEEALKVHDLKPIDLPHIDVEQREPPIYITTVPLKPEVDLGDYRSVRVAPEEVAVTDEHVLSALDRLRESQAVLVPAERPLRFGDFALIDVNAVIGETPFLEHKGVNYEVTANSQMPLPGFAEALVGMSAGESREFTLTVPEDFRVSEFAGQECGCSVTLEQVRVKELPELSDSMAKTFGFDTLEALRDRVGADLESNARNQARSALLHKALEQIAAQSHVDFPPVLEENEITRLLADEAKEYGYKQVEDYLAMTNKSIEEIREELRPLAHQRVVNGLILERVSAAEEITVAESEIDERVEQLMAEAKDNQRLRQMIASPETRDSIGDRLETNRVLDRLVEIVTGQAAQEPVAVAEAPATEEPEVEEQNG